MAFVILLLRALFGLIDGLVFWAGAELYDLMIQIASAKVFQQETIMTVSGRVYQLLGLIMLFKLIFSFVTYIINPDDMTDKNKGYANLIKKIIISLCLIVITPWAFTQSRNLQIYIIEDKVIEYFVFGQTKPSNASAGYNLMYTVGKQFVKPYACKTPDCKKSDSGTKTLCGSDWDEKLPNISQSGKFESGSVGDCAYGVNGNESLGKALLKATQLGTDGKYDLWTLMKLGTAEVEGFLDWFTTGDDFAVDYQFLFSTLVGIAIDYMLIIMCIDMAVRAVKLAFYEIIAPVPIISYVGFKDGKDSMLNKWFGQVVKTYADLFTRVAGLQIAVFFIDQLKNDGFEDNGNFLVTIFLILGALTFAKELPKILEGMGIKFSGGGFNLKKKLTDDMAGSKLLRRAGAAGLGLAGGMAANAIKGGTNFFKDRKANHELKKEMRAAGYTGLMTKGKRNEFYKNNADMRGLGSVRHRRDYARQAAKDNYRENQANRILEQGEAKARQLEHTKNALENTANQRRAAADAKKAQLRAKGMSDAQIFANADYKALNQAALDARSASTNFNASYDAKKNDILDKALAQSEKVKNKNAPIVRGFFAGHEAAAEFTRDNASEFTGGIGSVIAGGVSAAARAATSKDGQVFSGAASGVKGAVDARDTRDKRTEADYGFGTRVADTVRGFAGVDTVAKSRANELHDEINELQLKANAAQKRYTDATDDASRNAAMAEYQSLQTSITKTQKKLEKLYESSKK